MASIKLNVNKALVQRNTAPVLGQCPKCGGMHIRCDGFQQSFSENPALFTHNGVKGYMLATCCNCGTTISHQSAGINNINAAAYLRMYRK